MGFLGNGFIGGSGGQQINYKWKEKHTVLEGDNTLTLSNIVLGGEVLEVFDTYYGVKWDKVIHWNINGQVVTFTSSMPHDIEFEVVCYE